jgi:carbon-monoxide dehydrogenase medium subunit
MVEYHFPESVEDASRLMQQYGERARFIAGGTDLLLLMERQNYHPEALIDLTRIQSLHHLGAHNGQATVGAAVTYSQLLAFPPIYTAVPFLRRSAGSKHRHARGQYCQCLSGG